MSSCTKSSITPCLKALTKMANFPSKSELPNEDLNEMLEDFAQCLENEESAQMAPAQTNTKCVLENYSYKVYKKTEDYSRQVYIFREIIDTQQFTTNKFPSNDKVQIVGFYAYEPPQYLLMSLTKFTPNVKNPAKIVLDMTALKHFPQVDSFVEVFGRLQLRRSVAEQYVVVLVHFLHELGQDIKKVIEYVDLVKEKMKRFPPQDELRT